MWVFSSALSFLADMGHARRRPKRLAEKLLQIRKALGLSQREMANRIGLDVLPSHISKYERDKSEPGVNVLLAYARIAELGMDQIVDDKLDLEININ